jgi:hypothetical protein
MTSSPPWHHPNRENRARLPDNLEAAPEHHYNHKEANITSLDEAGRGSTGPTVGPRRRKDKHNYLGPQTEAKYNSNHRARQRSTGYEETAGKNHS